MKGAITTHTITSAISFSLSQSWIHLQH